jgi:predicted phosphodiesterase
MTLTIGVASDLHCQPGTRSLKSSYLLSDGPRVPGNSHPVQALFRLIAAEKLQSDILALPGDFSDQADHHGFVVGLFNAREIGLKLQASNIIASLGNHDVDSHQLFSPDHLYLGRRLFSDFPCNEKVLLDSYYGAGFAVIDKSDWQCLIVNSVVHHVDVASAERGLVTSEQLEAIGAALEKLEPNPIRLCLVHHHPLPHEEMGLGAKDLMEGGEELLQILEKHQFGLVIHGHKHHPRLRYSTSGNAAIPVFASGSLAAVIPDRLSRSVRNTFHLVQLQTANTTVPSLHGNIRTWELSTDKGWVPSTLQSAGFPHRAGFGCRTPAGSLITKIKNALGADSWMEWDNLLRIIPELEFLSPIELRQVGQLSEPEGIFIKPRAEEPFLVGKTSTPK